jgi:hypothetical protein
MPFVAPCFEYFYVAQCRLTSHLTAEMSLTVGGRHPESDPLAVCLVLLGSSFWPAAELVTLGFEHP